MNVKTTLWRLFLVFLVVAAGAAPLQAQGETADVVVTIESLAPAGGVYLSPV